MLQEKLIFFWIRFSIGVDEMAKKNPVSEYLAKIGKKGGKASGKARLTKLTPEKRSEVARKAAAAGGGNPGSRVNRSE